jgi:carbonic anhydrase
MAVVDEVRAANEEYATGFSKGDLPMPPGRKFAVITCMDARLDPAKALGLEEGDAHVMRNTGGRAADALRSRVISQRLLGTEEILVVHHTDCGMSTFDNPTLYGICREGTPPTSISCPSAASSKVCVRTLSSSAPRRSSLKTPQWPG